MAFLVSLHCRKSLTACRTPTDNYPFGRGSPLIGRHDNAAIHVTRAPLHVASESMISAAMPKTLVGISVAMLILAAVFGVLNNVRVKGLHADLANTIAARDAAQRGRMAQAKESKSQQTN